MRINKLKLKLWLKSLKPKWPTGVPVGEASQFANKDCDRVMGRIAKQLAIQSPWIGLIEFPPRKWYQKIWDYFSDKIQGWWFLFRWNVLRYRPEIKQWKKEADEFYRQNSDLFEDDDY